MLKSLKVRKKILSIESVMKIIGAIVSKGHLTIGTIVLVL